MHRFNISNSPKSGEITLDKAESRHALTVLRVKAGEVVELLDGKGGVFRGIVTSADKEVKVAINAASSRVHKSAVSITIAASVVKPEAMDLLVQKSCELGADTLIPVISERTVVRLSAERWQSKNQRWQKIVSESCKQCGRPTVPAVRPVLEYKKLLGDFARYDLVLIPTLAVEGQSLHSELTAHRAAKSVLILIGPEGDFSQNEVSAAMERGAKPVSLGPWVLRSETAALYLLAVLGFFYREVLPEVKK